MSQSSYAINQGEGRPGLQYDIGLNDVYSLAAEVAIPFGKFVCKGSADTQCKLPGAGTDVTDITKARGVSLHTNTVQHPYDNSSEVYPITDTVSVLKRGRVWVQVDSDFTSNDPVLVVASGADAGTFSAASGSVLEGAKFLNSGSANGLAILEFDLLG